MYSAGDVSFSCRRIPPRRKTTAPGTIRNINGALATGSDFFGRERELLRLARILLTDSLLLTAPRRVGKSSLVLRLRDLHCDGVAEPRFRQILHDHGLLSPVQQLLPVAVYFNAEDCTSELDFAKKLVAALQQQGKFTAALQNQIGSLIRTFTEAVGLQKISLFGLDVPVGEAASTGTIRSLITSLLHNIESQPNAGTALVAVDELPEFLLILERQQNGPQRVSEFLHWLRALRQEFGQRVRWIFLGSIGLDTFVDQRSLTKTLSGLVPMSPGAWEADEAHSFPEAIGPAVGLELSADVRVAILQQVGWALPYHLQIIIQALSELKSAPLPLPGQQLMTVETADVSRAVERLLQPDGFMRFDTWRQRLKDQLTAPDHAAVMRILRRLAVVPAGLPRLQLLHELQQPDPHADPDVIAAQLSHLLAMLQRDGYLLEQHGRYAFRSFLLREFWYRREVC